jgi:hypothetical protein
LGESRNQLARSGAAACCSLQPEPHTSCCYCDCCAGRTNFGPARLAAELGMLLLSLLVLLLLPLLVLLLQQLAFKAAR